MASAASVAVLVVVAPICRAAADIAAYSASEARAVTAVASMADWKSE